MKKSRVLVVSLALTLALTGTALASGGGGHADSGVLLKDFLYRCFNFAVAAGILGYFLTKPLRKGMADRRENIAKSLNEAEKVRAEAEAKFAEYDAKLTAASAEIDAIYAEIKREGELERDRILAGAKEMAQKIREEASRSAAFEVARARAELRQEAAAMAIEIAEGILKKNFTAQDQSRLVDEYLKKVGELH